MGILSQDILKVILGIFLIIISVLFLVKPSLKVPTNRKIVITGGGISGLITGLVGTGDALRGTFLTGFNLEKTKYIATASVIALEQMLQEFLYIYLKAFYCNSITVIYPYSLPLQLEDLL